VREHRGDGAGQAPDFAPGSVLRVPGRVLPGEDHAAGAGQRLGDAGDAARPQQVLQAGMFQDVVRTPQTAPRRRARAGRIGGWCQRR
jgi:hypothetical protein